MNNDKGKLYYGVGLDNSQLRQGAEESKNILRGIGKTAVQEGDNIDNTFRKIGEAAAAVFTVQKAIQFSKAIVQVRGDIQQLEIAFETMLGSKAKADKMMSDVIAFAQKTPFTLTEVASNAKQLMAMGIAAEDVMDTLKSLGDVAAGVSVPIARVAVNYGQVSTLGRLQSREIRDFAMAGIPIVDELANMLGKTTAEVYEMVEAGKVGFPMVQQTFKNMSSEGGKFYNLMEKQNASVTGQISKLQDQIQVMFNKIGEANEGIIYKAIGGASALVENYEQVATAIMGAVAAIGAYKAALAVNSSLNSMQVSVNYAAEITELQRLITVKEASKNQDVEQLVIDGRMAESQAKKIIALRAEAQTQLYTLKATAARATAAVEVAKKEHRVNLERALSSKQMVKQREVELSMAKLTGDATKIELAEKSLLEAQEQRHVTVKARKASANTLAIAQSKAAAASTATETFQQKLNTASTNAATKSKALLTIATQRLSQAFRAMGLAFKSNPIGMIASILLTAVTAFSMFKNKTDEATDAVTGLAKAQKTAGEEFDKEAAKVQALQDVINNGKVAYDERKKALNELKGIIPGYNAQLTEEGALINNNTEAIKAYLVQLERQIKMKAAQDELEEAYRQKRQLEKERIEKEETLRLAQDYQHEVTPQKSDSKVGTALAKAMFGNTSVTNDASVAVNRAQSDIDNIDEKLQNIGLTIQELNREIETTGTATGGGASDGISTFAEQLATATQNVESLGQELAKLRTGETPSANYAKDIADKEQELKEAQTKLHTLLNIDPKQLKASADEVKKYLDEYEKIVLSAHEQLASEEVQLERDKIEDKIALIEFDRKQTIAAIERTRAEALKAWISGGNDAGGFNDSIFQSLIEQANRRAKDDTDNVNVEEADKIKAKLEALKQEFETYEQERIRIQSEYAAKRRQMYEDDGETLKNGFNQGNLDELDRLQTETLNAVDLEIASREASFNTWINRLVGLGLNQLKEALQTARQTLNSGGGNLSDKEKAALRAKIVALEKQIDVENTKSPEQRAAEKSKKQWGDTIKVMNGVQETVGNIINSFDGLDEATKKALSAATNIAGGIIGMISGIQALAVTGAEAIKSVERASVILAIIGTAVQIITAIFNLAGAAEKRHQEALAEIARNKVAMQREYNQLLFEQNLLLKEATSVFGVDEITKAINAFEQYRDQLSKYKDELKGTMPAMNSFELVTRDMLGSYNKRLNDYKNGIGALNEITIKTGHEKTGLFGWGKGRDIYTPILQVYDDIIDKEGKLNIERVKAIIATQELGEEDKARLQSLIDIQENAEKAKEELNSYLESTFGDLGGNIMDAITDGIKNGTDAWKEFGKTGASVLEKLGKQIAYELFFSEKFKILQAKLTAIYGSGKSPEEIAIEARNVIADFYNGIGEDMKAADEWLKQWKAEAKKQEIDLWSNEREASQKGIATASQESVDENNGRLTAIQGHTYDIREAVNAIALNKSGIDISSNEANIEYLPNISANVLDIQESTKILADNSKNTLELLLGIESNTGRLHSMSDDIADVRMGVTEMRQTVNDIALKGIKLK